MKIKVISYNEHWMAHKCTSDDTEGCGYIDIMIDGYIPNGINPEHLVGMEFDIACAQPFVSIAYDVN